MSAVKSQSPKVIRKNFSNIDLVEDGDGEFNPDGIGPFDCSRMIKKIHQEILPSLQKYAQILALVVT